MQTVFIKRRDRKSAALHHAAHIIVAKEMGATNLYSRFKRSEKGWASKMTYIGKPSLYEDAVIGLAGLVAEELLESPRFDADDFLTLIGAGIISIPENALPLMTLTGVQVEARRARWENQPENEREQALENERIVAVERAIDIVRENLEAGNVQGMSKVLEKSMQEGR